MKTNMNGYRLTASSILAIAAASAASISPVMTSAQESSDTAEASDSTLGNGAIVVTARKREESLLEVPLAISALGSEEIEQRGITSVTDLVENTPGINVSSVNSGRNDRSFQQISLRGFTPSTTNSTLTASFIDGVPVASATALNAVIDPARIEILRGPQNAYFGRNAFAGAINIVTQKAADTFGGSVSAEWSERNGYDVTAAVQGPLVEDQVSFRLTGRSWGTDGGYKNSWNPNQTLGDQSTRAITGQLNFTPSHNLKVSVFGMYSEDEDGPSAEGVVSLYELRAVTNTTTGAVAPNYPFLSGSSAGTLVLPSQANCVISGLSGGNGAANDTAVSRPYICGAVPSLAVAPGSNTPEDALLASVIGSDTDAARVVSSKDGAQGYGLVREYRHVHLTADYEIDDTGLTVSGLFGYNNEFYSEIDDLDQYDSSAFVNSSARGYWTFPYMVERVNKDISGELRVAYDQRGPVQAMLGVSYLDAKTKSDLVSLFTREQYGSAAPASSLQAPGRAKTTGIFGSFSYDFTDALNVSLEARYQIDKIYAIAGGAGVTLGEDNIFGAPADTYTYGETYYTKDYKNFLPRAILSFDVNPDVMVYASYARAANVSIVSFNSNFVGRSQDVLDAAASLGLEVVLKPETLDNYEVGLKGEFLDGRLRATLAGYYGIWKNQYNNRSVIYATEVNGQTNVELVSGVANSGKTLVKGLEADIWAEPFDGLTFTLAGAMNDTSIRSFSDPSITRATGYYGDDFKGNSSPLTSKWSANAGVMYTGDISSWDDGSFFIRADVNWKSKVYVNASNLTWIKDRAVVNVRTGINREGYSLQFFVNNLLDDDNYTSVAESALLDPYFTQSTYGGFGQLTLGLPEPRTFGIRAGYSF